MAKSTGNIVVKSGTVYGYMTARPVKGGSQPLVKKFVVNDEIVSAVSCVPSNSKAKAPRTVYVVPTEPFQVVEVSKSGEATLADQTKPAVIGDGMARFIVKCEPESKAKIQATLSAMIGKNGVVAVGFSGRGGKLIPF